MWTNTSQVRTAYLTLLTGQWPWTQESEPGLLQGQNLPSFAAPGSSSSHLIGLQMIIKSLSHLLLLLSEATLDWSPDPM